MANTFAALGDGTMFMGGNGTTYLTLSIWKAENTAIIGPAQTTASAGAQVQAVIASGYYPINALMGSQSKTFTMKSGANLYGNAGSICGIGVGQQGM